MREYHKIEGLFKRDEVTKKLLGDEYRNPVVEMLKNCDWEFTEKIDGTNVRVVWDGHKVSFYGRTDRAELPKRLVEALDKFCWGKSCSTCPLCNPVCRCGCGTHFLDSNIDGAYVMTDDEIRAAYKVAFGRK